MVNYNANASTRKKRFFHSSASEPSRSPARSLCREKHLGSVRFVKASHLRYSTYIRRSATFCLSPRDVRYPVGICENSPAFQGWEPTSKKPQVPKGRLTLNPTNSAR